ncbi:MAG: hypothetical protein DME70_01180 [Verrucomicrobia bacterium]|nr:MAG: hypothetical protein DME70_01180 [Verrucomicrobiota bacterium]
MFFTEEERERAQSRVLEVAALYARIVSGAVVGALALTDEDRWSDLDLTFAVADEVPLTDVFEDWTGKLAAKSSGYCDRRSLAGIKRARRSGG